MRTEIKNKLQRVALVATVLFSNNSLGADADFLKSIFFPKARSENSSTPTGCHSELVAWDVPPIYQPGWLENTFLEQQGLPEAPILNYPNGGDNQIRVLTLCHPTIKAVVKNKMESLLAEHNDPNAKPELMGDFLQSLYNNFQSQIAFPESYSETDKTQALLDLTFVAAASVSNQFWTTDEAQTQIGVNLPDSYYDVTQPISVVYLDRQPRIFSAPLESCLLIFKDILWRCLGPDRDQHVNAHRQITRQFDAYLQTGNPKLIKTNLEVGHQIIRLIAALPISRNSKLELLSSVVGLSWESEETGHRLWQDVKTLSPLETIINPGSPQYRHWFWRHELHDGRFSQQ